MKKLLLSIAVLMFATSSQTMAQYWSFGPKVGVNFSSVNDVPSVKTRTGVVAGMFAERSVNNWFSIQTELLWSQQGFHQEFEGNNYKTHLNYINMPVLTKFYITGGLNLQLGAQFGYLVTAEERGSAEYGIKNQVNKFNTDIVTGLAYDFDCGLVLEGRYVTGLTPIVSSMEGSRNGIRNGNLQFMVGWKF